VVVVLVDIGHQFLERILVEEGQQNRQLLLDQDHIQSQLVQEDLEALLPVTIMDQIQPSVSQLLLHQLVEVEADHLVVDLDNRVVLVEVLDMVQVFL
jgi:hypothetical protein